MRYDVFGRLRVEIIRSTISSSATWQVFYLGNEGKKRAAKDIAIPASIAEDQLADYLADLFHEYASDAHSEVVRLG